MEKITKPKPEEPKKEPEKEVRYDSSGKKISARSKETDKAIMAINDKMDQLIGILTSTLPTRLGSEIREAAGSAEGLDKIIEILSEELPDRIQKDADQNVFQKAEMLSMVVSTGMQHLQDAFGPVLDKILASIGELNSTLKEVKELLATPVTPTPVTQPPSSEPATQPSSPVTQPSPPVTSEEPSSAESPAPESVFTEPSASEPHQPSTEPTAEPSPSPFAPASEEESKPEPLPWETPLTSKDEEPSPFGAPNTEEQTPASEEPISSEPASSSEEEADDKDTGFGWPPPPPTTESEETPSGTS